MLLHFCCLHQLYGTFAGMHSSITTGGSPAQYKLGSVETVTRPLVGAIFGAETDGRVDRVSPVWILLLSRGVTTCFFGGGYHVLTGRRPAVALAVSAQAWQSAARPQERTRWGGAWWNGRVVGGERQARGGATKEPLDLYARDHCLPLRGTDRYL
jgi:hypothetical protein